MICKTAIVRFFSSFFWKFYFNYLNVVLWLFMYVLVILVFKNISGNIQVKILGLLARILKFPEIGTFLPFLHVFFFCME